MTTTNNNRTAVQYPYDALAGNSEVDTINSADAHTLDEAFRERVRRSPNKVAYSQFDSQAKEWIGLTWSEMASEVERWQVALRETGLKKGDRVAICYRNSIEWVVFDQAALRLGLVLVPLYTADRADNIAYVINDSGAKLVLFANALTWNKVVASEEGVASVENVLVFADSTPNGASNVRLVDEWLPEYGQHFERGLAEPDDLASIVYTSGTTGRPKGVMLSHRNLMANAYNGMRSVALTPNDKLLSFLPLSHTFERTVGYYAAMLCGSSVTFSRSIGELASDLKSVKPNVMVSVPRIFERVHNQIFASLESMSPSKRLLFKAALRVGWYKFRHAQGLVLWHPRLLLAPVLDHLVAKTVRDKLGGQLDYVIVGGAPLSVDVAKTFISLGIPLLQGYGLTESSPVVSVNTRAQNRPDSIGLPLRGVEAKLMDKDELWVKGDSVMLGYWNNDDATKKVIVEDQSARWLKTGDLASIDDEGFIRIIGRIKDILVLANGEKVPPPDIEAAVARNPLFEQVMVIGEGKSFLTALVVLNPELFTALCDQQGWNRSDVPAKALNDVLVKQISTQMSKFPGYARIRRVHVCADEWTVEDGLLTPTLKIKRPQIMAYFADEIDSLYAGHGLRSL